MSSTNNFQSSRSGLAVVSPSFKTVNVNTTYRVPSVVCGEPTSTRAMIPACNPPQPLRVLLRCVELLNKLGSTTIAAVAITRKGVKIFILRSGQRRHHTTIGLRRVAHLSKTNGLRVAALCGCFCNGWVTLRSQATTQYIPRPELILISRHFAGVTATESPAAKTESSIHPCFLQSVC